MRLRFAIAIGCWTFAGLLPAACGKSGGGGTLGVSPNGVTPSLTPLVCQASCNARTADGNDALNRSDYAAAFEAYRCGDTPEAAFGAGLSTLLTAIEGPSMTQVLSQLGQGGLKATDIASPNGWFARYLSRAKGTGTLTRSDASGGTLETVTFKVGHQRVSTTSGQYAYSDVTMLGIEDLARLTLSVTTNAPLVAGQRIPACSSGSAPYASISYSTPTMSCNSGSSLCSGTDGAIVVTKPGTTDGSPVEYTLDNVPVSCTPRTYGGQAGGQPQTTQARLKGTISTFVVPSNADLSNLPPTLTEPWDKKLPAGVNLDQVLASASGIAGSLELASCYFNAAGSGVGDSKVFEIPAPVFGAAPVVVSRGDAKIAAGLASLFAAGIVIAEAYRLPLELRSFVCSGNDAGCLSSDEQARRLNAGIGALADREKIAIARRLLAMSLTSWSEAPAGLGPASIFVKNDQSAPSIEKLRVLVDTLRQSIDQGSVALPYVTPEIRVDLRALFDNPPDPDKISVDPLVYDPQTKKWDYAEAFFDQAFPTSTFTVTRDGSSKYVFDNNNSLVLDPASYRFESYFPF
jgi:hypothetical protein